MPKWTYGAQRSSLFCSILSRGYSIFLVFISRHPAVPVTGIYIPAILYFSLLLVSRPFVRLPWRHKCIIMCIHRALHAVDFSSPRGAILACCPSHLDTLASKRPDSSVESSIYRAV